MSPHEFAIAIVLGLVEGITEFLPVSSTGHLIVAGHALGFTGARADTFEVFIQLGAILAIAVLYRQRLRSVVALRPGHGMEGRNGLVLLALTSLPGLVLGEMLHGPIKEHLFSPATVAIGWGVGGLALLLVERCLPATIIRELGAFRRRDAVLIGIAQCLALWPGVSRSAATMSAGMLRGIDRKTAAEYSFLAALPVITAAALFDLAKSWDGLARSDIPLFALGFAVAFAAAWVAVRTFLRLLATVTLRPFGWYRLVAATVLAGLVLAGWI